MKIPQVGDMFFTGFESEFGLALDDPELVTLEIIEVEGVMIDDKDREGRSIIASDGIGYQCFWSEKVEHFVYGLSD